MPAKWISAVIPTRGDVDLREIIAHLRTYPEIDDIVIYVSDSVYGRYEGMRAARHGTVFTQDDDCVTEIRPLIEAIGEPWEIVNAMTPEHEFEYHNSHSTLIGFGAIFERSLTEGLSEFDQDATFRRECDRVFTALVPHRSVMCEVRKLPWATADNRLYRQPEHGPARREIDRRIEEHFRRRA